MGGRGLHFVASRFSDVVVAVLAVSHVLLDAPQEISGKKLDLCGVAIALDRENNLVEHSSVLLGGPDYSTFRKPSSGICDAFEDKSLLLKKFLGLIGVKLEADAAEIIGEDLGDGLGMIGCAGSSWPIGLVGLAGICALTGHDSAGIGAAPLEPPRTLLLAQGCEISSLGSRPLHPIQHTILLSMQMIDGHRRSCALRHGHEPICQTNNEPTRSCD